MVRERKQQRTIRNGSINTERVTIEDADGDGRLFYVEVEDVCSNTWITLSRLKLTHLHAAIGALLQATDRRSR